MEILLIRHGQTEGNLKRRYIGRTDLPLCGESVLALRESEYRGYGPDLIYSSPLVRCVQTAQAIFPDREVRPWAGLEEMDFGEYENKTYEDLKDDPGYRAWVDSRGLKPCPGGESGTAFRQRCAEAFLGCVNDAQGRGAERIAVVAHGGTIMSVMERFAKEKRDYYEWQPACGGGYLLKYGRDDCHPYVTVVEYPKRQKRGE